MPNGPVRLNCEKGLLLPDLHELHMPPERLPKITLDKPSTQGSDGCKTCTPSEIKSTAADVPGCKCCTSATHWSPQPGLSEIERDTQFCNGRPAITCESQAGPALCHNARAAECRASLQESDSGGQNTTSAGVSTPCHRSNGLAPASWNTD